MSNFFDSHAASGYAEGTRKRVPGLDSLHRMATMLLVERMPRDGKVLVLGAGGGLEIRAFADAQPGWSFCGIDPSPDMLALAAQTVGPHVERVKLQEGYIEGAPDGPFDAAVSLLTFHFIPRAQRMETLRQIRRRLRDGAPFILAHISFAQTEPERSAWIKRHVAYSAPEGMDEDRAKAARQAIGEKLTILAPDEEEAMLGAAGFSGVELFYAGLSFRGWVAYAEPGAS